MPPPADLLREQHPYLASFSWDFVTHLNEFLCQQGKAFHGPTSDGHDITRNFWNSHHQNPMFFTEAVDFLYQCHRKAPFCFFNGNTFVAITAKITETLPLEPLARAATRTVAGHIVAGTDRAGERGKLLQALTCIQNS